MNNTAQKKSLSIIIAIFLSILIFMWTDGLMLSFCQINSKYDVLRITALFIIVSVFSLSMISLFWDQRILFDYYFIAIIVFLITVMIPSSASYLMGSRDSLMAAIQSPMRYWAILVYGMLYITCSEQSVKYINNTVIIMTLVLIVLQVAAFFFPHTGRQFMADFAFTEIRFGSGRLTPHSMRVTTEYVLCFFFAALNIIKMNRKVFYVSLILFAICFYYSFFVTMTRRDILAFLVIFVVYRLKKKNIIDNMLIFIIFTFLFFLEEVFSNFRFITYLYNVVDTVLTEFNSSSGNVGVRMYGIMYYWNLFKETNYIGFGMPKDSDLVMRGFKEFSFNLADQGLFAVFFMFGIPALLWCVFVKIRVFKDLVDIEKNGSEYYRIISQALIMFFILRIITATHLFYWHHESIWWGIFLFMISRMKMETQNSLNV